MAAFKDTPLKQVVDDLNLLNAATAPVPLTVEQCVLSNPVVDLTGGGLTNTRATLTIPVADENYPAGSLSVHYRRLALATLTQASSVFLSFFGPEAQTKTLTEILQLFSPGLATYLLPELVDEGPYDLTRTEQPLSLTPKADSLVLTPTPLVLHCATAKLDLIRLEPDMRNVFFKTADPILAADADFDQEMLNRIFERGVASGRLPAGSNVPDKSEVIITYSAHPSDDPAMLINLEMRPESPSYEGSISIAYYRLPPQGFFGNATSVRSSDEIRMREAILEHFAANNLLPPKLPADMGLLSSRVQTMNGTFAPSFDALDPYYWTDTFTAFTFQQNPITVVPLEVELEFEIVTAGAQPNLFTNSNILNGPTQLEVVSAPAGFAPTVIPIVANKVNIALPVGMYRVKIKAPDARAMTRFGTRGSLGQFDLGSRIKTVYKAIGVNFAGAFAQQHHTSIPADVFDSVHAHAIYDISSAFTNGISLTAIPQGIFDPLKRCETFASVFYSCDLLTSIPPFLFKDQGAIWSMNRTMRNLFRQIPATTLPSNFFHNLKGFSFAEAFSEMTQLTTVPADLWSGTQEVADVWQGNMILDLVQLQDFERTFWGTTALQTIPASLFNLFKNNGRITNFDQTFSGSGLTAIPETLFDYITPWSKYAEIATTPTFEFHRTFGACASLTAIPENLFQHVELTYPGYTFANLNVSTIPAGLLRNQPKLRMTVGLFQNSKVTAVPANLMAESPALIDVSDMFSGCSLLAAAPADLVAGKANLKKANGLFAVCPLITSISPTFFSGCTSLLEVKRMFNNTPLAAIDANFFQDAAGSLQEAENVFYGTALVTAPANLFNNCLKLRSTWSAFAACLQLTNLGRVFGDNPSTEMYTLVNMFQNCTALQTIPVDFLKGIVGIRQANGMFQGCTQLTTVPAGLFTDTASTLTDVSQVFYGCTNLLAIPANLFVNAAALTVMNETFRATGITSIPVGTFPATTAAAISLRSVFQDAKITTIANDTINGNAKVSSLYQAFRGCPLESVGTLWNNNSRSTVEAGFMLAANRDFVITAPVIRSTVPLTLTAFSGAPGNAIFGANSVLSANITNAFDATVRFGAQSFFSNFPSLQGDATAFITKHAVDSVTAKGIFKGSTALTNYASLPAWATTYP